MKSLRFAWPPRPWPQLRLRTVFLVATAAGIFLAWPRLLRQYAFWRLCQYGDLDFSDLWTMKDGSIGSITPSSAETEAIEILVSSPLK